MTPTPIGSLTLAQQSADARGTAAAPAAGPTPEQVKAAKDFEAIFIRQLLSSLEKSSGLSGGDQSGGAVFRSMMVNALADTAAEGGGIGLRDLITRAMLPPAPQGKPHVHGMAPSEPGAAQSAPLGSVFQSDALGKAPASALGMSIEPTLGPSLRAGASERLGVEGHVLTRARPALMLTAVDVAGEMLPTGPEGNK